MAQDQGINSGIAALADLGFGLHSGEEIEQVFRPNFLSFLQRTLVVGILTTLGFSLVPGLTISFAMQVGLALLVVVVWFFVFDEWQDWRDRRADLWILTNQRLILVNPREEENVSWLNLADIVSVRRVAWWSLRLKARDGRATLISYVGPTGPVRASILARLPDLQDD